MKISLLSMFRTRSFTVVCFYVSSLCLALQFVVFLMLIYILDDKRTFKSDIDLSDDKCIIYLQEDIEKLVKLSSNMGFNFIMLDRQYLTKANSHGKFKRSQNNYCRPVSLGIDYDTMVEKQKRLLTKIVDEDFVPVTFYNIKPQQLVAELDHVEITMFLTRKSILQIVFLHPREDNTWWFGDIHSDLLHEAKLASINLTLKHIELMKTEGAIERFEIIPSHLKEDSSIMIPKDISTYLTDISNSKFIECNTTRATLFRRKFRPDQGAEAMRFRHKAWKMLSRVKTVLDSMGIVFWLSSGTALGYYRECDIIAHSKDVDIGVWAASYTDRIVTEMHNHGFRLKISLGFPNDSLELSFIDQSGIKLDIFFFYQDETRYWNGGTQVKSGKKFKYDFPKFTLCWTLFKDLRVRVPCETEEYIKANYGPDWFTPVRTWDWKTSPFNVKPNGMWRKEQLADAIKLYAT